MENDAQLAFESQSRQEAMEASVFLVAPSYGYWAGRYMLPRAETDVACDGETVDKDSVTAPQAKLMTRTYPVDADGVPWVRRFTAIGSRLTAIKEKYSLPFPINGVRIIPKAKGGEFMHEMFGDTLSSLQQRLATTDYADRFDLEYRIAQLRAKHGEFAPGDTPAYDINRDQQSVAYELHAAVEEFCDTLPDILRQIENNNSVYRRVHSRVPKTAKEMRKRFHLEVVPVALAGGKTELVTESTLAEHAETVRLACQRRVEEAIETMIAEPRKQLAEAMTRLATLVSRDGRVTTRSFGPIHDAIAKIRMFDFVADDVLLRKIREIEQTLGNADAAALRGADAEATAGFTTALNAFVTEVTDAAHIEKTVADFGRPGRIIDID